VEPPCIAFAAGLLWFIPSLQTSEKFYTITVAQVMQFYLVVLCFIFLAKVALVIANGVFKRGPRI